MYLSLLLCPGIVFLLFFLNIFPAKMVLFFVSSILKKKTSLHFFSLYCFYVSFCLLFVTGSKVPSVSFPRVFVFFFPFFLCFLLFVVLVCVSSCFFFFFFRFVFLFEVSYFCVFSFF